MYWPILLRMTIELQARLQNEAKERTPSLDLHTTLEEVKRIMEKLEAVKTAEKSDTRKVWSQHELTRFLETGVGVDGLNLKDLFEYLEVGHSEMQGGLRRIKVATGEHKWLCKEHCRQDGLRRLRNWTRNYKMKLDETLKTVEAIVKSEHVAEGLYENIVLAEMIQGLDLTLKWNQKFKSLLKLQDFMSKSCLLTLTLNLANYSGDQLDGEVQRYKPILEMAQQSSLQNLTLKGLPSDFFRRSNLTEGTYNFSNLTFLRLDHSISQIKELKKFKTMVLAASQLSVLVLNASEPNFVKTFNLIQEARTGDHPPMQLQFRSEKASAEILLQIVFPPLSAQVTSICPPAKIINTEHLFEDYGSRIQRLQYTGISNSIIEALDKGTRTESNLVQLTLWIPAIDSNKGVDSLFKVVGQDQLQGLQCDISKPAQLSVLKTIQWTKLQHLMVNANIYPKGIGMILTEVYAAVKAVSHRLNSEIALQEFIFKGPGLSPTKSDLELLEKVLKRLTALREFSLNLRCSIEECCKLVKYLMQTNTQLERLILNGAGYSNEDVDKVLIHSQILTYTQATGSKFGTKAPASRSSLKLVVFKDADISLQLVEELKAKGIELRHNVVV
ncbi:hypothetical protein BG003_002485 [Podila horticola]|nr:hypothetical protein BG003_002485 [Podila horticola]